MKNKVADTEAALRRAIRSGRFKVGAKLPTEAVLTDDLGVSRTVLREAVAALRADGLLDSRQGAGVFVLRDTRACAPLALLTEATGTIASVVEELELRAAVEIEAAGLAASRASPGQLADIETRHRSFGDAVAAGEPTERVDYEFHLAIARATNNARFEAFLAHLGARTIPRVKIGPHVGKAHLPSHDADLNREHRAVVIALVTGDDDAARGAMRLHLVGALARYRTLIHELRDE